MKYIRTQGGIYEVIEETFKPMENNMVFIPGEGLTKILNQADTIKELCDEFVVEADELGINKHYSHSIDETLKDAKQSAKIYKENYNKKQIIYGAIWTNKGLIYVAKMNEKGELELL